MRVETRVDSELDVFCAMPTFWSLLCTRDERIVISHCSCKIEGWIGDGKCNIRSAGAEARC